MKEQNLIPDFTFEKKYYMKNLLDNSDELNEKISKETLVKLIMDLVERLKSNKDIEIFWFESNERYQYTDDGARIKEAPKIRDSCLDIRFKNTYLIRINMDKENKPMLWCFHNPDGYPDFSIKSLFETPRVDKTFTEFFIKLPNEFKEILSQYIGALNACHYFSHTLERERTEKNKQNK